MNKQELIKKFEERKTIIGNFQGRAVWWEDIKEIFEELDEPSSGHADEAPRYVKNVLARLRELPAHDRVVWLKAIMSEFEQDFSHAKWREGYEQGKFEGMIESEKVVVPQKAAEYIEQMKNEDYHLLGAMTEIRSYKNKEIDDWFHTDDNMELFARAWLDGYDVEKEKRYLVKLKGVSKGYEYLNFKFGRVWIFSNEEENEEYRTHHTKKELEESGFGWVFDCPGIEIEEVT